MKKSESSNPVLEKVIEYEVSLLDRTEIAGAYRSICAMLLLRTATVVSKPARERNLETSQKRTAERWMNGQVGVITFEEACRAIDVDPTVLRKQIENYAENCIRNRSEANTQPDVIFGRQSDDTSREVQTVP